METATYHKAAVVMPVTKKDLMQRFEVSAETIAQCERVGILRSSQTGDVSCYAPNSFLHMEVYLKGRALGIGISECKALIEQAEEDARARKIAYARQMAARTARGKKPN